MFSSKTHKHKLSGKTENIQDFFFVDKIFCSIYTVNRKKKINDETPHINTTTGIASYFASKSQKCVQKTLPNVSNERPRN
jgi:hypothetical protein